MVTEVIANYTQASGRKERAFSSSLWVTHPGPSPLRMELNESNARQMALAPRNSCLLASAHGQALPLKASLLNHQDPSVSTGLFQKHPTQSSPSHIPVPREVPEEQQEPAEPTELEKMCGC